MGLISPRVEEALKGSRVLKYFNNNWENYYYKVNSTPLYHIFKSQDRLKNPVTLQDALGKYKMTKFKRHDDVYRIALIMPPCTQFFGPTGIGKSTAMMSDSIEKCGWVGHRFTLERMHDCEYDMTMDMLRKKEIHPYGTTFMVDEGDERRLGTGSMAMNAKLNDIRKRIRAIGCPILRACPNYLQLLNHYFFEIFDYVRDLNDAYKLDKIRVLVHDDARWLRGSVIFKTPPKSVLQEYFGEVKSELISRANLLMGKLQKGKEKAIAELSRDADVLRLHELWKSKKINKMQFMDAMKRKIWNHEEYCMYESIADALYITNNVITKIEERIYNWELNQRIANSERKKKEWKERRDENEDFEKFKDDWEVEREDLQKEDI